MKKKKIIIFGVLVLTLITCFLVVPSKSASACQDGDCSDCLELNDLFDTLYYSHLEYGDDNWLDIYEIYGIPTPDVFNTFSHFDKCEYIYDMIRCIKDIVGNVNSDIGYDLGYEQGESVGYEQGKAEGITEGKNELIGDFIFEYDSLYLGSLANAKVYLQTTSSPILRTSSVYFIDVAADIFAGNYFDLNLLIQHLCSLSSSIEYGEFMSYDVVFEFDNVISKFDLPVGFKGVINFSTYCEGWAQSNFDFNIEDPDVSIAELTDVLLDDFKFDTLTVRSDFAKYIKLIPSQFITYHLGYTDGQNKIDDAIFDEGYKSGVKDGYKQAKDEFYDSRYDEGYGDGYSENNFSLRNLFWIIAGLPFESVKSVWNVEFLGVNIASFLTGLLMFGVVIFVLKKVIK